MLSQTALKPVLLWLGLCAGTALGGEGSQKLPLRLETKRGLTSRLSNIHVSVDEEVEGSLTFTYGSCSTIELRNAHHVVGRSENTDLSRMVWVIPEDAHPGDCISAWDSDGVLVGRSDAQYISLRKRKLAKKGIEMTPENGIEV